MNDRCVFEFYVEHLFSQSHFISPEFKIMLVINMIFMLICSVLGAITLCG